MSSFPWDDTGLGNTCSLSGSCCKSEGKRIVSGEFMEQEPQYLLRQCFSTLEARAYEVANMFRTPNSHEEKYG